MQQLWDYALFLLFLGGETKDYIHWTACIIKYGAVMKFSLILKFPFMVVPPPFYFLVCGFLMFLIIKAISHLKGNATKRNEHFPDNS